MKIDLYLCSITFRGLVLVVYQVFGVSFQATAEQMRIAQMTSGCDEDPEIKKKINQVSK